MKTKKTQKMRTGMLAAFSLVLSLNVTVGSAWESSSQRQEAKSSIVLAQFAAKNPLLKQANYFRKTSLIERLRVRKA